MRQRKLDKTDLKILRDLQRNGRMTNAELAGRAGISAPPCLRRIRSLEEDGFIRGYHADISPEALGYEVLFFAFIGLDNQSEQVLSAFEHEIANWNEVLECHMARGPNDFILKLVATNTNHENELTRRLTALPHVVTVLTSQIIRTELDRPGVAIEVA